MGETEIKRVDFVQTEFFSPSAEAGHVPPRSVAESVERLKQMSRPEMVRVAPEKYAWVTAEHCTEVPEYCLARWVKSSEDSLYRLLPVSGAWVRMTSRVADLLGWNEVDRKSRYDTLKRLGNAGFIEFVHAAPGLHFLELRSWFRHLADCQENPDIWEKGSDDLKVYQEANGLGGWKR